MIASEVSVGRLNWLGRGVTIGHDTSIDECAFLAPGVNLASAVRSGAGRLSGSAPTFWSIYRLASNVTSAEALSFTATSRPTPSSPASLRLSKSRLSRKCFRMFRLVCHDRSHPLWAGVEEPLEPIR